MFELYDLLDETGSRKLFDIMKILEEDILHGLLIEIERHITKMRKKGIDLFTIALAIGALYRASEDIVTYITRWDIKALDRTRKWSFFLGLAFIVASVSLGTLTIISAQKIHFSPVIMIEIAAWMYILSCIFVAGFRILYDLTKDMIKSGRDLKRYLWSLIKLISFVSVFIAIIGILIFIIPLLFSS